MEQIKVIVAGKVQGVWFRQSTKQVAEQYNIVGYANNLPDSSVEVVAIGEDDAIAHLIEFLHQGPESAQVTSVSVSEYTGAIPNCFTTG